MNCEIFDIETNQTWHCHDDDNDVIDDWDLVLALGTYTDAMSVDG